MFENHPKCRIEFWIFAFSTNFCPIKTDLSGNTVWPQASGFEKLAKMNHFWHFWLTFVYSKCKRNSLRSQCWMIFFSVIFKYSVEKIWIDFLLLLQNSKSFPWLLWPLCVLSEVDALDMRPKSAWALSFKKSLLVSMGPSVVVLEEFKNFLLLLFNRNSRRHFIPVWHDLFISYVISVLGGPWRWSGLLSQ